MELKELNHAGEQGVFGALRVLGDVKSKNIQTLSRDLGILQNVTVKVNTKIDSYWDSLSSDGIITPVEKISLHKEWEAIEQTYAALLAQVTAKALVSTSYWQDYKDAYDALKELLFETEKIFDDMYNSTTLSDIDDFNLIFHEYYYSQQFVQVAITSGLIDKLGLRGLESLTEPGVEGELAFYRGELYQYHNNAWERIGTDSYLGMVSTHVQQLDEATEGNYFLASGRFYLTGKLFINNEQLYINNEIFYITIKTKVGKIYSFDNGDWHPVPDSDPRYLAILADYMNLTGQVPALLLDCIEEVVREPDRNPKYLGISNTDPAAPKMGDYYVYSGITTSTRVKDRIYRYNGTDWEELDPDNDGNSRYYMNALQDILTNERAGDGFFSVAFCNAFFTNKASINALKVHTIYLEQQGAIQSNNADYTEGLVGLKIDADGNIDANGDSHIKGKVAIGVQLKNDQGQYMPEFDDYDVVIGGNTLFTGHASIDGTLNGATGTLKDIEILGDSMFRGTIDSGPLLLSNDEVTPVEYTITKLGTTYGGEGATETLSNVVGTYGSYSFDMMVSTFLGGNPDYGRAKFKLEVYKNGALVYSNTKGPNYNDYYALDWTCTYHVLQPGGTKTFKLRNLPTTRPQESGIVYNDNGTLKIS